MLRTFAHAHVTGEGVASRRGFLKTLAVAGGAGALGLSWPDMLLAKADDLKSQPSGDAGDRVACGVIGLANPRPGPKQ